LYFCYFYSFSYHNLLKRGVRIAIRSKVNESLLSGISIIDASLPVGLGQRQLILGDRYTGKTTVFISMLLCCCSYGRLVGIGGFGSVGRIIGLYIGISQNLSKLIKLIRMLLVIGWSCLIIATHSASSSLLSYMIPLIGISIGERLRDRGNNVLICFDDLSKHSKSFRQISLLLEKIPARDAFPSDVFQVHSSLLERSSVVFKCRNNCKGTISALPIIETIASDITEFIATNIISITDGQFYLDQQLKLNGIQPAINSGLSVSRIGSNAQSKLVKLVSSGIKNELTYYRTTDLTDSTSIERYKTLTNIITQDHLFINSIEVSIILLINYTQGQFLNKHYIYRLYYILSIDLFYLYYIVYITKNQHNHYIHNLILSFFKLN